MEASDQKCMTLRCLEALSCIEKTKCGSSCLSLQTVLQIFGSDSLQRRGSMAKTGYSEGTIILYQHWVCLPQLMSTIDFRVVAFLWHSNVLVCLWTHWSSWILRGKVFTKFIWVQLYSKEKNATKKMQQAKAWGIEEWKMCGEVYVAPFMKTGLRSMRPKPLSLEAICRRNASLCSRLLLCSSKALICMLRLPSLP